MADEKEKKEEITDVAVITTGALESITRGEIDVQIATAHRYPRSLAIFNQRALDMVSIDEETAVSCIYSRPVGKDPDTGKMKYVEGLSVRTAEIVGASYGNLRVGSMLIEQTERQVKARGFAHDLESNFQVSSEVVEATVDKYGKPFSERMRTVTAKACLAKARRDATFQVVPKALCKAIERKAREVALGKTVSLEKNRASILEWISKLGIDKDRVFAGIEVKGLEEIGRNEIETLIGLKNAIKDGDTSVEDAFPPIGPDKNNVGAPREKDKPAGVPTAPACDFKGMPMPDEVPLDQLAGELSALDKIKAEISECENATQISKIVNREMKAKNKDLGAITEYASKMCEGLGKNK